MSTKLPRSRILIAAAALLLAALTLVWTLVQDQRQGAQIDALHEALTVEQEGVEDRGETPIAPGADEIIDDPGLEIPAGPPGPSGPPGPAGPSLSSTQIQAAFADYFAAHPYEFEPSAAELTAAFASVLSDHPDLLNDELYEAMASYLAANPPPPGPAGADGKDGTDGQDGEPGRPPTKEEIRTEVEAYVAENPIPPSCPEGYEFTAATLVTVDGPPLESVVCAAVAG
jgi:hypothetical protein